MRRYFLLSYIIIALALDSPVNSFAFGISVGEGKVKASSTDTTPNYLDSKVDSGTDGTIEVDSNKLRSKILTRTDSITTISPRNANDNLDIGSGSFTGGQLNIDNLNLNGNAISSTDTNGNIIISPNGSGKVGIGATPSVKLSLGETTEDLAGSKIAVYDDGTNTKFYGIGLSKNASNYGTGLWAAGTYTGDPDVFIETTGNVGVGTKTPIGTFHIRGGNTNNLIVDNNGSQYTELGFANDGTRKTNLYFDNTASKFYFSQGNGSYDWVFNNGNVGIGKTPATELDVNGTITATSLTGANITVGAGKTLDVSAGTLTLAADQISGDKVEGGTINAVTVNTLTLNGNLSLSPVAAASRYIILDATDTGTGALTMQAGGGSAAWGGAINLFSHSHATKPGWVVAGISAVSGTSESDYGRFTVNSEGLAGGNDLFTVIRTGNIGFNTTSFGTSAAKVLAIGSGTAPTTSPADAVQLWSGDTNGTAGKAGLHIRTEDGTSHVFGDKVGIGTTTPESILTLKGAHTTEGDAAGQLIVLSTTAYDASPKSGIIFKNYFNSTNAEAYMASIWSGKTNSNDGDYSGYLVFGTRSQGFTVAEAMRISSYGNIIIGGSTENGDLAGGIIMANATAASANVTDGVQLWSADSSAGAGTAVLYARGETAASNGVLCNFETKTDTGDPTGWEGRAVINTTDNTVKIYADGGWRTIASGW